MSMRAATSADQGVVMNWRGKSIWQELAAPDAANRREVQKAALSIGTGATRLACTHLAELDRYLKLCRQSGAMQSAVCAYVVERI